MRLSRRHQLALLVLLLVCAYLGWRVHDRGLLRGPLVAAVDPAATRVAQQPLLVSATGAPAAPVAPRWVPLATLPSGGNSPYPDGQVTNRLRNTAASLADLMRNDRAMLLRNALVDTANGEPLSIPAALRSQQPAEAYLIQAQGALTKAFQDRLVEAGATVISYIPNNALLVRASAEVAEKLATSAETAALMPLEPYFKLSPSLLNFALTETPLPDGLRLVLTIPDAPTDLPALSALGAREVARERGPFGTLITVDAPKDSLVALAGLPSVHRVEPKRGVRLANDLTAFSIGSTTTRENTNSFEGLDGDGVLVNINDSGVDASSPDLTGRVFTLSTEPQVLTDSDGHGTHVAGSIAGDGSQSDQITVNPPQGSVTNANFKGKAPKALLYALPVDLIAGPASGDSWLQESAAEAPQRFNSQEDVLISNNSWGYFGLDPFEYTTHSASYDAAVRDALPRTSGDQPILYVFAAGNEGLGGNNGIGGFPDTIVSPGNAKNVITVGALESLRGFTNAIVVDTNGSPVQIGGLVVVPGWETNGGPYFTNEVLLPFTDTDWQIASFSSRGNVGIGIEGTVGRFKPDVVAEGSFIASVRSTQWSPAPLPDADDPSFPVAAIFDEINAEILPPYRFELGTSMAAPAISGLLAQLQQYFEYTVQQFPSAAAYKALLINSARSTSPSYVPTQEEVVNYAGWGKPNLQRALGRGFKAVRNGGEVDIIGVESTTGITTGNSADFELKFALTNAIDVPLRIALVWTDPPGDPLVGPKLVNDLDLIVSNKVTGELFWGNDFDSQTGFSRPHDTNEISTNGLATLDRINNVERIVLPSPIGSNLVITVVARRVNVNSVRSNPSVIAQDFALAFSSDIDPAVTNTIGVLDFPTGFNPIAAAFIRPPVQTVTNSYAFLNQRAGANSPLEGGTNGQFKQWQFYVFTNMPGTTTNGDTIFTNGSNVAFVTFPVGNLSRSRTNGPDVDLYVSKDRSFTNLNETAVAEARKSTSRGGNELVYFIGEALSEDNVFYVGVKSEDHQAGEYGFVGVSTDEPFTSEDENGFPRPLAIPVLQPIPDGTPANPGLGLFMAISIVPEEIRAVYADVATTHQNFTDLSSALSFNRQSAVLQNHTKLQGLDSGTNVSVLYDDTGSGLPGSQPSDGPGSLIDFLGNSGGGVWFLESVDNALGFTGKIEDLGLSLVPNDFGEEFVLRCVRGGFIGLEVINVPPEASRLTITITNIDPALPLEVFIKREAFPDITDPANNDKYAQIPATGGSISIGIRDVPPLEAGRYFIAVYNPHNVLVCYRIRAQIERNLDSSFTRSFVSTQLGTIPDAARRFSSIEVDDPRKVTAMDVGLRVNHPRLSDLTLRLENPNGYSAVLFEDRGGINATNLGQTVVSTNDEFQHVALTYDPASQKAAVYVNGLLSFERSLPPGFRPATSNEFFFALNPQRFSDNQGVTLDDFGIWRRTLRPQEIRDIYLRGVRGEAKQPSDRNAGLFALWPFNGNGNDVIGTNRAALVGGYQFVDGQFPGSQAVYFPELSYGYDTNFITLAPGTAFSLEGWVYVQPTATNAVYAGWWGAGSQNRFGPGLLTSSQFGAGSITAVMTDINGTQIYLNSPPNQFVLGRTITNVLFASFSENTNRSNEKIKFVPPPFTGQLVDEQLLSLNDFESVPPGSFQQGTLFRGWEVLSNTVAVLENSLLADNSRRLLALSNGVVRRTFPAVVGETYKVVFSGRLAPQETNAINPQVSLDGFPVTPPPLVLPTNEWNTNIVFEIRATKPTVVLEFNGFSTPAGSAGMLVDNVQFYQSGGTVSYLSEEPLRPLLGAGFGTWLLEINDTRTPYVGDLLEWQLTFTFAPISIPAVRLTNGIPFTTNAIAGEPQYFFIDIPLEATATTNLIQSLTGGPLALWYNQLGLPGQGGLPEDYALVYPTTGTNIFARTINTNVPPVLIPGQRYYLSVENLIQSQSNQFTIQVDFGIKITPLTNGIPVVATNLNDGLLDYYSFQVSSNALGVSFLLTNLSDNLQLVARKGPQLPTRTQFDYASTNGGVAPEVILIDQSSPVPLTPGTWYLGVYSASTNIGVPITYTIVGNEVLGSVVGLTNGVPYDGTITNSTGISYFYLDIVDEPITATFALTNLSGNANLYLRQGLPLPATNSFAYASTNGGTTNELITLIPGSQPVPLTVGRWFLAVVAVDPLPLNFTVVASYVPNTFVVIPLEDSIPFEYFDAPPTNSLYFSFDVNPGVNAVLFELYGLTGEANLRVSQGVLPSFAQPGNIFTAPNPGPTSQRIAIRTDAVTNLAGPWYLEVQVLSTNVIDFTVRAATQQDGLLTSGEPLTVQMEVGPPLTLTFDTIPGELYSIQATTDLSTDPVVWVRVGFEMATSDRLTFPLPAPGPTDTTLFYRVVQEPQ